MTWRGLHRLNAEAYPLWSTISLAVRIRSTAPMVKIRHDNPWMHRKIHRQGRAFPISTPRPAASDAHRLPNQNPKSP
jgi:hypothetical protein